jgi:lysophospholipase L1-like esterase
MTFLLGAKQRLLLTGDSITDAGRAYPVGTFKTGLGEGYPNLVNSLLTASYPELAIEVLNTGIGGNTVRDLSARWQTDVLDLTPDWLTIMIGVNDVWWGYDETYASNAVDTEEFTERLTALVETTKPLVTGLVLLTPYLIEKSRTDTFRRQIEEYAALVKSIGEEQNVPVVDTQAAFDKVLETTDPSALSEDKVHPTQPGHMIIAKALLHVLGYEF